MIKQFILKHANEYLDSNGEYDILSLTELVQRQFSCSPRNAEEYVYEALGLED